MIPVLLVFNNWALFLLRIVVASVMLFHGVPKLRKLNHTNEWFSKIGFKPGWFWGTLISVLEAVGGFLLLLGVFTQVIALLFAIEMLVGSIWKKLKGDKFVNGYELDLILLVSSLILVTMGGGHYSLLF